MFFSGWSARSRTLAQALTELELSTGPEGFELTQELDPENDGWFEAYEVVNYATAAREIWAKKHKNPEPGSRIAVRYTKREADPTEED